MKKKLSVLFILSFIAAGSVVLYKTRSPGEKLPLTEAQKPVQTAGIAAQTQAPVKKAKK